MSERAVPEKGGPQAAERPAGESGRKTFSSIRQKMVRDYYAILERSFGRLFDSGISPNVITVASLLVCVAAGYAFGRGSFLAGGCLLFVSAVFDTLDGAIARKKGLASLYGALLDSTLDRYSDFAVFFGLMIFFRNDWIFFSSYLPCSGR